MQKILRAFSFTVLLCAFTASATMMDFTATSLGGDTWRYDYSVTNDTLGVDIDEFTIYFDHNFYANLSTVADAPPGWDSIVIQPDPGLPDDGFYDSLALIAGIAPGETLSGFSVTVDYFGAGLPGAQFW
ncbi:MAG: hypothetical protein HKN70_03325, partial [Gammaproteobacteria bacterium]|nr:hypothetical protein [Gammaproteobacteria bacterium]